MPDIDLTAWAEKLGGTVPRQFNLIHQTAISVIFFMNKFDIVSIGDQYVPYFDAWVAANLIAMAAMLLRRSVAMPRVAERKCLDCGHVMVATMSICKNCGGTWTSGKQS